MLTPWRYDISDTEWSYKCSNEKNSPAIPALPYESKSGAGCLLGQAVYLFCGWNTKGKLVE